MPKMTDATNGLSGTDLEGVALKGETLQDYRAFWERSAEVDSIRAISDQDDEQSFEVSGRTDAADLAPLLPEGGGRALEIGCGTGRVMQHVAPLCEHVQGIDISEGMVEQGRKRLAHLPNVSFQLGNGYDLSPFEDGSFDVVYSLYAFQHMPKTTAYNYFVEAARVLRPEGALRFQVPNILREEHFLAFHHFTQPWFVEHPYPMHYYTPSEVVSLLGHAGFRVVDLDDGMTVVARKSDDRALDEAIHRRVARFEHPWLARELDERTRQLAEANAELEAMRRRKAVRVANALRHPIGSLRTRG